MATPLGLIFTIEVDGKPTMAFEASKLREAAELCNEEWLRADLNKLSSSGTPLCGLGSKLKARIANQPEREIYRDAAKVAAVSDDILFVYLLEVDGGCSRVDSQADLP